MTPFEQSDRMKRKAEGILQELKLIERWSRCGRVSLVGALSFDLILTPDIDMEIYCPEVKVSDGMSILSECTANPRVTGAMYQNELAGPDKAIYWRLSYLDADQIQWKIDMWSAPADYALPRGEDFVAPMRRVLTPETREAILTLKLARERGELPPFISIDLYRAVIRDGIRDAAAFAEWLRNNPTGELSDWKP